METAVHRMRSQTCSYLFAVRSGASRLLHTTTISQRFETIETRFEMIPDLSRTLFNGIEMIADRFEAL